MIDPENVPPVDDTETLARFVVYSNEFRKSDKSIKPKAFMPYSRVELSVNRHRESSEAELWSVGEQVASERQRSLYGRSDIAATSCRIAPLDVEARPLPANPNHADVIGYPPKKEDQQSLALMLVASASKLIAVPRDGTDLSDEKSDA